MRRESEVEGLESSIARLRRYERLVAATVRLQAAARGRAGLQKVTSQRDLNRRRASAVALTESRAGTVRVTIDPESHRVSILTGILAHRKQSSEAEEAEAAMKVQRI